MCEQQHQGWTNFATFSLNLQLEQNPKYYAKILAMIRSVRIQRLDAPQVREKTWTADEYVRITVAGLISDFTRNILEDIQSAHADAPHLLALSLADAAVARVDWNALANYWIEKQLECEPAIA